MKYKKLGKSDIDVSLICLGTMTWGEQNTQKEAFEQMNFSFEKGVNFFDTAELYSVPPRKETFGSTEIIIGNWFKQKKCRDKIILASKVVGRSGMKWFRNKETRLNEEQMTDALHGSLKRLSTDYIDLYQVHWPDRKANFFGKLGYEHVKESDFIEVKSQLEVLKKFVDDGKVRYVGLSNETPWGVMKFLSIADQYDLPRMVSIQNPYSLLNRSYEVGLAEVSIREDCGLLAYSPLAFGMLTGKYDNNSRPDGARLTVFGKNYTRYTKSKGIIASGKYNELARQSGLTPAQMALSYVNGRKFVTSNIIGATTMKQLKENIESVDLNLENEILEKINEINNQDPYPCP